jgi:phosphoribosylglycinamide formyltransferase-1
VALLASGTGSIAQSLLDATRSGALDAEIVALGSDRESAALGLARHAGVETFLVRPGDFTTREAWDAALAAAVAAFEPELVVLAGFMRILGPGFLERFGGRTINTHPSLLPAFPGAHAVRDALAAGASETGCTVHWVDGGLDTGPVIAQRRVPVLPGDDVPTLHERVKAAERELLPGVLNVHLK